MTDYTWKWFGELARGVAVAVLAYGAAVVVSEGVPETREAILALLTGALPVAYAAVRLALTKSPIPTKPE